jgi:hypothetical protein
MSTVKRPPEPWHSFLRELDEAVDDIVRLDCIGGFVVTQLYGLERPTADIDVIELAPREQADRLRISPFKADRCTASTRYIWIV